MVKRFNAFGAHQFRSPNKRINAGTNNPLTKDASSRIANATPKPSILIDVTPLNIKDANTIASNPAAAVIIRADLCRPVATDSILLLPASCSSLIRERRKTS